MLAKIKFERSLSKKNEPQFELVGWTNVRTKDELPEDYLKGIPCFYAVEQSGRIPRFIIVYKIGFTNYEKGDILTYEEYSAFITAIKTSGKRFTEITKRNKRLMRKWKDKEIMIEV